jgi:HD-GYP domain-containing protein (c-di-GMP phosphodiesterase class II)
MGNCCATVHKDGRERFRVPQAGLFFRNPDPNCDAGWVNIMKDPKLRQFQDISALLNSSLHPTEIRKRAIEAATLLMEAEAGSLLLVDEALGELYFEVAHGEKGAAVREIRLKLGEGIAGHVAQTGEAVVVNDVQRDARFFRSADRRSGFTTRNMVCAPVKVHGKVIGVLQAINRKDGGLFDEDDLQNFVALGHQVSIAIENARLYDEIRHLFEGFISASVQAIESRDPTTSGHSNRVALLTCRLAEAVTGVESGPYGGCRFDDEQMKEIRYAALLHDFGKVGVREHILVKARKLYPGELALVKARFDFIKRTLETQMLRQKIAILQRKNRRGATRLLSDLNTDFIRRLQDIDDTFSFIVKCNQPNVSPQDGFDRLHAIAKRQYESFDGSYTYLSPDEVIALSLPAGSLTPDERREIESHVTHTFDFLSKIPWTSSLRSIPAIAYSHHEKLDGTGYPRKLVADQIPVQSRMMTICDIYDALTASDRPYKPAIPASKALGILEVYAKEGKVDAALLALFIDAKVYQITQGSDQTPRSACA